MSSHTVLTALEKNISDKEIETVLAPLQQAYTKYQAILKDIETLSEQAKWGEVCTHITEVTEYAQTALKYASTAMNKAKSQQSRLATKTGSASLFIYLFIYLLSFATCNIQVAGSPQQYTPITVGPLRHSTITTKRNHTIRYNTIRNNTYKIQLPPTLPPLTILFRANQYMHTRSARGSGSGGESQIPDWLKTTRDWTSQASSLVALWANRFPCPWIILFID
jgi:hypothetical protein